MRTVRSAARSRNQPRGRLGWFLAALVVAFVLLALAAARTAVASADTRLEDRGQPRGDDDELARDDDDDDDDDVLEADEDRDDEADEGAIAADTHGDLGDLGDSDGEQDDAWTSAHGVEPVAEERAFAVGMTADDVVELADRHYRPSRWGRVDVSLSWTRSLTLRGAPEPAANRVDEIWLRAVWRL